MLDRLRAAEAHFVQEPGVVGETNAFDETCLSIYARDVLKRLRSGDAAWETMVPPGAAALIKERRLLGDDLGSSEGGQATQPAGVSSSS